MILQQVGNVGYSRTGKKQALTRCNLIVVGRSLNLLMEVGAALTLMQIFF